MDELQKKLLQQDIKDTPFTDDLKNILAFNQFKTLDDVLKLEVHNWHKKIPGFNYHHQHEIVSFLMKNNLGRYLKQE